MRFGIAPPNYAAWFDADTARTVCAAAEDAGYDSLWFGDHIALPRDSADVFGNAYLDVFAMLAFAAAVTERVRLGTNVLVVPYRDPVVAAKLVASVDQLSKGRIDLGVGVGHWAGEFAALGIPFAERGRRTDEYLAVMRALWENDCASFSGEWVRFEDLCPLTRPVQQPLPLLIGGDGPRSARRALDLGAGWAPGQGTIAQIEERIGMLRDLADAAGEPCPRVVARWLIHPVKEGEADRPISHRGELRRPRLTPQQAREQLHALADLGVAEVIVDIPAHAASYLDNLELVARDIIDPALRADRP